MTLDQVEQMFDDGLLSEKYAEYLMKHSIINNGDMLVIAMERCNLLDDFLESMVTE